MRVITTHNAVRVYERLLELWIDTNIHAEEESAESYGRYSVATEEKLDRLADARERLVKRFPNVEREYSQGDLPF